jgi:non-heme chloroperoxidase
MQAQTEKTKSELFGESRAEMLSIEANGVNLGYVEQGKGQPVIFVHGTLGDYRYWDSQIEPFAKSYRAISYSRRCSYPNKYVGDHTDDTIANNAEDLAALVENLGAVPAHLVGHSYGGFIAMYCALKHPELFRTLVIDEPAALPLLTKIPPNPLDILALFLKSPSTAIALVRLARKAFIPAQKAVRRGDSKEAVRIFVNAAQNSEDGFEQLPDDVRSMFIDNRESLGGETFATTMPRFSRQDASRISAPTLLVKNELAPKIAHRIVDILAETLPNNEMVTLQGGSHMLHAEKPRVFNERILEFLAKHS